MLHTLMLILDTKLNVFHFCDEKLGWNNGDIEQGELWYDAFNSPFETVETALIKAGVAEKLIELKQIRSCGNSIDYQAKFDTTESYRNTLDFFVVSNGSKWAGQKEDPLSTLFENLEAHPLEPNWCKNGFKHSITWLEEVKSDPHARFNGHVQYIGNFVGYSAGFSIYVLKGSETEAKLDAMILKNMQTDAFKQYARDFIAKLKAEQRSTEGYETIIELVA